MGVTFRKDNPKRSGSAAHARYERYKIAESTEQALQLGARAADIPYDKKKGFLTVHGEDVNGVVVAEPQAHESCTKQRFLNQAEPWQLKYEDNRWTAAPFRFKERGSVGWFLKHVHTVEVQGKHLTCCIMVRSVIYNSSRWLEGADGVAGHDSEIRCREADDVDLERTAAALDEIGNVADEDTWKQFAGNLQMSIGPFTDLTLQPQIYKNQLGWHGRLQKGRPAAAGSVLGVGGVEVELQDGMIVNAPCQVNVEVLVKKSEEFLQSVAPGAAEMEQAVAAVLSGSEDEVDIVECGESFLEDLNEPGSSEDDEEEHSRRPILRPIFRPFRGSARERRGNIIDVQVGRRPHTVAQLSKWHGWFKIMNAKTFFERVSEDPKLLHSYTKDAAPHDLRDAPDDRVLPKVARLLQLALTEHQENSAAVVDLGCGKAGLAREIAALYDGLPQTPKVTSVDAVSLAQDVIAANLASLPERWSGRFQAAVLCRSLWARDYPRVLAEAKRVLKVSHRSCLIVVEPFLRWWGRLKQWPETNALIRALQRSGFWIDWQHSSNTEPRSGAKGPEYAVFQYIVAYLEPKKCVLCRALDARIYRHGLHLCVNCEEEHAGLRPVQTEASAPGESEQSPAKCRLVARGDRDNHAAASLGNFIAGVMGAWKPKGYAFITPCDGGKAMFCHVSNLRDGERSVLEGDACMFTVVVNTRTGKYEAANVVSSSSGERDHRRRRRHDSRSRSWSHRRPRRRSRTPKRASRRHGGSHRRSR